MASLIVADFDQFASHLANTVSFEIQQVMQCVFGECFGSPQMLAVIDFQCLKAKLDGFIGATRVADSLPKPALASQKTLSEFSIPTR
jgi:hypothetical protein